MTRNMGFILGFLVIAIVVIAILARPIQGEQVYGATFSTKFAAYLGLDWRVAYTALLDEMPVKKLRIPVYWDEVEAERGVYRFDDIDWMMSEAQARGVSVTLAIGQKVPRWPEWHIPSWASELEGEEYHAATLEYLRTVVEHYKENKTIERWQIENEYFFPFGEGGKPDRALFEKELALVRELDGARPIQITTSGEQSIWRRHARYGDIVGPTLYRKIWSPITGHMTIPLPPCWYRLQARLLGGGKQAIISELQVEPWIGPKDNIFAASVVENYDRFTATDAARHLDYAKRTGLPEAYLWGSEWWYFLKEKGDDRLWRGVQDWLSQQ